MFTYISALSSAKIGKNKYLAGKETLPAYVEW